MQKAEDIDTARVKYDEVNEIMNRKSRNTSSRIVARESRFTIVWSTIITILAIEAESLLTFHNRLVDYTATTGRNTKKEQIMQ